MGITKEIPCAEKHRVFLFGGEKGIRTLEVVLALTRFPVVRLRPAQPSLRMNWRLSIIHNPLLKCKPYFQILKIFLYALSKMGKHPIQSTGFTQIGWTAFKKIYVAGCKKAFAL